MLTGRAMRWHTSCTMKGNAPTAPREKEEKTMAGRAKIPAGSLTAYDARQQLPDLAAWMDDDMLKLLPLWRGSSFAADTEYFDLDNPDRGAFVATGAVERPGDHTYVSRAEASEDAWTQLVTWRQPLSDDQAEALQEQLRRWAPEGGQGAAGEALG
jgi:hypothetical protein